MADKSSSSASAKHRRFSTALPSVASLRSKFERPAAAAAPLVPAIINKASFRLTSARKSITSGKPAAIKEDGEKEEATVRGKEEEEDEEEDGSDNNDDPTSPKKKRTNKDTSSASAAAAAEEEAPPAPRKKSIFQTIFGRRASSVSREQMRTKAAEEEEAGGDKAAAPPPLPPPLKEEEFVVHAPSPPPPAAAIIEPAQEPQPVEPERVVTPKPVVAPVEPVVAAAVVAPVIAPVEPVVVAAPLAKPEAEPVESKPVVKPVEPAETKPVEPVAKPEAEPVAAVPKPAEPVAKPAEPKPVAVVAPPPVVVAVATPPPVVVAVVTPPPPVVVAPPAASPAPAPVVLPSNNGILLCSDGYSWTLDAMRQLALDIAAPSSSSAQQRPVFLDPTTCRSQGMLDFLAQCVAVVAFVDSALVSQTVQFQLARASATHKPILLLQCEETEQELAQLFGGRIPNLKRGGESGVHVVRFTSALRSRERTNMLAYMEAVLGFGFAAASAAPAAAPQQPVSCKYLVTGYSPDACDVIACQLQALGYGAVASRDFARVRGNAMIVCLPSAADDEEEDSELDQALVQAIKAQLTSGMPCIGVQPSSSSSRLQQKLLQAIGGSFTAPVLSSSSSSSSSSMVEHILHACDISANSAQSTLLRFQGDALEQYREVCCKSRRFSSSSSSVVDRLAQCKQEMFRNAYKTKTLSITAPAGWGKTTMLAELCCRHHPVLACLAKREFHAAAEPITVGALYFFSRLDKTQQSTSQACIKSLARQLMARVPGFALDPVLAREVVDDKASTVSALLDVLVVQPLLQIKKSPLPASQRLLIVLDAVDECEDVDNLLIALSTKWASAGLHSWLLLVCSSSAGKLALPSAQHVDLAAAIAQQQQAPQSHAHAALWHLLHDQWRVPQAQRVVDELLLKSQGDFLWLAVIEPLLVTWCETTVSSASAAALHLPGDNLVKSAVAFVFDGYCQRVHAGDVARVRQMYSLALCAPRVPLPVEIFSFCEDSLPPLLMVEDYKVKPLHAAVQDALLQLVSRGSSSSASSADDHGLISEALEQAYVQNVTKAYAAGHGNYHARLAGCKDVALEWFEDFGKLYAAVHQCVRETGDVLRLAQDAEHLGLEDSVVDMLRLCSAACAVDVREFVGQVVGRLPSTHALAVRASDYIRLQPQQMMMMMPATGSAVFSGLNKVGGPLKRVLRHRSPVLAAVESNGFVLTLAGAIGYLWNASSAARVAFLKGHAEDITACTFGCSSSSKAGDGTLSFMAFTGSQDKTAKFWQGSFSAAPLPGTPQNVLGCAKTFAGGHTQPVTCVAFKGAANLALATIATGSADGNIVLWDYASQSPKHVLSGTHTAEVRSVQIVSNLLLSASQDKSCLVWDLPTRSVVGTLDGHTRPVSSVAVSSTTQQQHMVYTGCFDGRVRCFDLKTRRMVFETGAEAFSGQRINSVAVNSKGTLVAASAYDGKARVLDALTGQVLLVLKGHTNDVCGVRFGSSSSSTEVITCGLDCDVRVWAVDQHKIAQQQQEQADEQHTDLVTCVAVNGHFAVSGSEDGRAKVWDLRPSSSSSSGQIRRLVCELVASSSGEGDADAVAITACCVAENGSVALTGNAEGQLLLWDCAQGVVQHDFSGAHVDVIETIQISRDGLYARSVACDESEEFIWDLRNKRTVSAVSSSGSMRNAITPAYFPSLPSVVLQEDSAHVFAAARGGGGAVGFTLDATKFRIHRQQHALDPQVTQVFGQMMESFFVWECRI